MTYGVVHVNARVDNVRARAFAGGLVIDIRGGARRVVRDARQTPGDVVLGDVVGSPYDSILLNVLNLQQLSVSIIPHGAESNSAYLGQLAHRI